MTDKREGHTLTLRLPVELHEEVTKKAKEEERTVSGLIRVAIRQYLKDQSEDYR